MMTYILITVTQLALASAPKCRRIALAGRLVGLYVHNDAELLRKYSMAASALLKARAPEPFQVPPLLLCPPLVFH